MRSLLACLALAVLAGTGCPDRAAPKADAPKEEVNRDPYQNVTPQKVKAEVEAAQKREEDRDDKILDKAKQ